MIHVPFKGPGLIELMANQVQIKLEPMVSGMPLIKSGKLKALAVSGDQRLPEWPNVPTVNEVLPNYRAVDYQVLMAPRNLPDQMRASSLP